MRKLTWMVGEGVGLVAAGLLLASLPQAAVGQAARSGGGGGNSQMMAQYQALASEKTALSAENAKLKTDLAAMTTERDALRKERDQLKARASAGDGSAAKVAAATKTAEESLAEQRKKMDELVGRYRDTATTLQGVERERNTLQADLASERQYGTKCAAANVELGSLVDEVLNRYRNQGWFHKATIDEPFTKITRNRVDNLVDDYKTRALEFKVPAPAAPKNTGTR